MVKIRIYTTILTNSVCKGNTFFRKHKRLHPKKHKICCRTYISSPIHYFIGYWLWFKNS